MGATTRFGLRYPADTDSPNGPLQIEHAVEDVETRLGYAGAQGGKSIIAGEQTRTNTTYGFMGTHDVVPGLVVPNDGDLIAVVFQAMVKETVASAGRIAIFLGSNQLKIASGNANLNEAAYIGQASVYAAVTSFAGGLAAIVDTSNNAYPGFATTGQVVGSIADVASAQHIRFAASGLTDLNASGDVAGGACLIRLAAGTYDVGVQYKASSGDILAKERYLSAWTKEFPASGV